jgi:hypothetical protein
VKYADPHACPACRGAISGGTTCPHCDFELTSRQAHQLWGLFVQADRLVLEGRSPASAQSSAPAPVGSPSVSAAAGATVGTRPPGARTTPARSWSTGSVLLALGAVCLVVAAIIFATVAWGSLGVLGRSLVLLTVTAFVGAAAGWATRRRLGATAEALWAVFLGLVTVDFLAALLEGLLGLDGSDFELVSVVWTAVLAGSAVAITRWARPHIERDLVIPQLAAGFAPFISAPALVAMLADPGEGDHWFWATLVGLLLPVLVTVAAHRNRLRWMLLPSVALAVGFVVVLVIVAMGESVDGSPVLTPLEALPSVTLAAAAVVGALRVPRGRPWLTGFATCAGLWLVGVAVSGWAWQLDVSRAAGLVAVSVVVALVAFFVRGADAWLLGARWGAVVAGTVPVLWTGGVSVMNLERIDAADAVSDLGYSSTSDLWVGPVGVEIAEGGWVIAVIVPLLVAWWAARRWTSPTLAPEAWWWPVAQIVAGAAVITAVASSTLPFLVHSTVLVVVGAALAFGLRRAPWSASLVPPLVVAFAMIVVPIVEAPVTAWAWSLAAAGFAVCSLVSFDDPVPARRMISAVSAGLGAAAAIATVGQVIDLIGVEPGWWGTIITAVAAASLVLTLALDDLPWHRIAIEVVAALTLLTALGAEADELATVSLLFTIGAVAAAIVGLLDEDRPYLRWVAAGLIGAAWVARLAASNVETVEAYTAPFAVALLAAGVWRLRSDPGSRTWSALAPGLTAALLPSLPQALDDPTGLRAGLLALVAAAVLAAGVVLRWGAPVAAGAGVLLLLVLVNVGPTAYGLQRWILIAIAGLVLLVVGTTWEKRVAEGRALVARLAALR